jgi:predicted nucleic-acid-binding protein
MIGIDTNILVRWLIDDPTAPDQSDRARVLIEGLDEPVMVAIPVIAETVWLARGTFGLKKQQILVLIEAVLNAPGLIVAERSAIERALRLYRESKADFVDCMIATLNLAAGCQTTLTFDKTAGKGAHFTLLS